VTRFTLIGRAGTVLEGRDAELIAIRAARDTPDGIRPGMERDRPGHLTG
jgi:hypothetical protein